MEIEFATGAVYRYFDVSPDVYQDLLDAPSPGQVFHRRIRGVFECHRTDEVRLSLTAQRSRISMVRVPVPSLLLLAGGIVGAALTFARG